MSYTCGFRLHAEGAIVLLAAIGVMLVCQPAAAQGNGHGNAYGHYKSTVAASTDLDYLMMLDSDDELRIDQLDRVVWADDPQTIYIGRRSRTIADSPGATPSPFRRVGSRRCRPGSRLRSPAPD